MTPEEKEVLKQAFKELSKEDLRQIVKEVYQENFSPSMNKWLDEQKKETYQNVGKWLINSITVAVIAAGMYLMYWMENHKP